ncbi:MAG: DUF1501 domain-containing protein, partial [Planctomycetaceae bacterium]|nr:DUF1501 domain-containing protein [Planctomycetaceae bacterium]
KRSGVSRRDFLAAGGIGLMGLPVAERLAEARRRGAHQNRSCILVLMNGGPSPWETFDPKPDAPREIRGPLRAISTAIPGIAFSESMPELAARADRLTTVRSLFHHAAPIHESGLQILQTGSVRQRDGLAESTGARVARELPSEWDVPSFVLINGGLHATGTSASVGDAGRCATLGSGPMVIGADGRNLKDGVATELAELTETMCDLQSESRETHDRYGDCPMGRMLLQSRQLVEQGVRFVTVNTFQRLEGERTWDAHGCPSSAPATVFDYQSWMGPQFDRAMSGLLDDLVQRGLWETTLVVCAGEIGRTPLINSGGGRDHWTTGFSALLAGGDAVCGEVIGATTSVGGEIADSPRPLEWIPERMAQFLGLSAPVPCGAELAAPQIGSSAGSV